jgi:hypothetical protein
MLKPRSATMKWPPVNKINTKNDHIGYINEFFDEDDASGN